MKITLTRSHNAFDISGINTYIWSIASQLDRRGFDVHVISGCGKVNELDDYWKENFRGNIHILKKSDFTSQYEQLRIWLLKGSRIINELKPDIIHFNGLTPLLLTSFPSVATCHGCFNDPPSTFSMAYRNISYNHFVDVIIAVSSKVKDELVKYVKVAKERVEIVPLGIDLSHFSPIPLEKRENALLCGWGKRKNPGTSLKVFHILKKKGLNSKLYVIGVDRKEALSTMPELACLSKDKNIIFTGKLNQIELIKLYQKVRAAIIPSFYEAFCYLALELSACGTPVVSSYTIPKTVISHGYNGFRIDARDAVTASKHAYDLLTDNYLWKSTSQSALKNAQNFSINKMIKSLISIYKNDI